MNLKKDFMKYRRSVGARGIVDRIEQGDDNLIAELKRTKMGNYYVNVYRSTGRGWFEKIDTSRHLSRKAGLRKFRKVVEEF